jgi:hypothetical protein
MRHKAKRRRLLIYFILSALLVQVLVPLVFALSAGPVLHFTPGGSYAAVCTFYEPVLTLDQTKPFGRLFWNYMLWWRIYPGGAYGRVTNGANQTQEANRRGGCPLGLGQQLDCAANARTDVFEGGRSLFCSAA